MRLWKGEANNGCASRRNGLGENPESFGSKLQSLLDNVIRKHFRFPGSADGGHSSLIQ